MNIGILLPGFSADDSDWAIPVQQNLVRELARADDVRVLALRYPHHRQRYRLYNAEVIPLGVGAWTRGRGRLALWWDALQMLRTLHREKPFDVLHAMWADETGLIAAWAGRLLGVPVVVSIAGGELIGLDAAGYGLQRSRFGRWTVGQALRGADVVLPACTYTRDLIARAGYALAPEKIRLVPLGVDAALFQPPAVPPDTRRLIHVASLSPVKDQTMLLQAVARLNLKEVTLDIIGAGTDEARLRALAAELDISARFIGSVAHPALPRYYGNSAVHLLTSLHEGFGMVTLEAAACGVPTVSTAVGIVPDDPALGISVPVGAAAALAAAVESLLHDETQRRALGQSARAAVLERYTVAHTVGRLREIYMDLI